MQRQRHKNTKSLLVVSSLLFVAVLAGACGGSSSGDPEPTGDGSGKPTPGGTLTYALEGETADGWCLPEAQLAISGIQVARSIYDTLTAPNEDGDYVPFLAKTLTPNADFTQWTVTLRPNITFHDGTALDSTVVKNNLDAYRGKYPARSVLLFSFVFSNIADVTVVDPLTVSITTKTPWASLPGALFGSGRVGMVAQSQLDDPSTCDTKLVGTGPFTLVNWTQNESLELKKNPNYWQKDADGTQLPYLDEIVYKPTPEGASRINGLLAGDLNAIQMSGGEQIDQLRTETEAGNINSYESDKFGEVSFGQLNTSIAPFNSKTARLAAIKSIDMEAYNATVNLDVLQNANGPFAPGGIGYLEDSGYPTYDLAGSKALVAQYKEETGTDLAFTLIATPDPATQAAAAVVQQMGKAAGINVTITALEQAALISTAISGKYQAMVFRNYPGGDPDANYVWWKGGGNPVNFGRFDDAEINALLDEGRATPDKAKRQEIYGDINKRFASEGYSIWLQWTLWDIATATDVFGTLGPDLPDDAGAPFPGLASGHPVTGMWIQS